MFYKIGHRGAAGHFPENTLASFKKALELDVNMIELDAHICKSQELVVIHDKNIARTTSQKGLVNKMSCSELLDLSVPTLADVLDLINQQVLVNIELKSPNITKPLAELIKCYIYQKNWRPDTFLISSFDKKKLGEIHCLLPQIKIGILVRKKSLLSFFIKKVPLLFKIHLNFARKIKAFSIHLPKKLITKEILRMAHHENLKVFAYTINSQKEINSLKTLGVDGIFSDYPERL